MEAELILFDFGGVIAPEGFQLGVLKLAQEFNMTFEEMYEIAGYQAGIELGFTAGKVSEAEYWKHVAKLLNTDRDMTKYRDFILDNFQPRSRMLELVKKLRHDYKVGIFSDQTNWIYELDSKYNFLSFFDHIFVSYDVGYTKLDDNFYHVPAKQTGIDPAKILIVDDKPRVIKRIEQAGMKGYLFTFVSECSEYLLNLKKD